MSTKPKRSFRWLLLALALFGLAADQAGKYGVFRLLYDEALAAPGHESRRAVIPGALTFHVRLTDDRLPAADSPLRTWSGEYQPHVNRGRFLGFGDGQEDGPNGNLIFAIISVAAAVAIIGWSTRRSVAEDPLLCLALGLILGGTLGNLYDRIVFDGVRDYLYWFFIIKTAVFNIADFLLVCGALLLLSQACLSRQPAEEEQPASQAATPPEMAQVK